MFKTMLRENTTIFEWRGYIQKIIYLN